MSIVNFARNPLALAAGLLVTASSAAIGQRGQQRLLRWSGQVDRSIDITIRGSQAYTSGQDSRDRNGGLRTMMSLPRTDGQLSVHLLQGRGSAYVLQQPSRSNGYTAVVRVQDPQSGVGQYRLEADWDGYTGRGNGRGVGRGGNGRYGTGDNNGRYGNGSVDQGGLKGQIGGGNGTVRGGYNGGGALHGNMSWSGTVDDQAEIVIRGNRADTRTLSGQAVRDVRVGSLRAGLPTTPVQVTVSQSQGRGQVWVVQQPTAQNDYTAIVRVRDPQAGASYYNLNVSW